MDNPILNPFGKTLSIFLGTWFGTAFLLILSSAHLFMKTQFQKKYVMTKNMIIGTPTTFLIQVKNYLKNKKTV